MADIIQQIAGLDKALRRILYLSGGDVATVPLLRGAIQRLNAIEESAQKLRRDLRVPSRVASPSPRTRDPLDNT